MEHGCQCIFLLQFKEVVDRIIEIALPLFDEVHLHRIHGDCHRANILERPGEGLMMIDFDDMVMGPAIQKFYGFCCQDMRRSVGTRLI